MDRIISEVTEIKSKPELYQMNASSVEPGLEKYIYKGNVCTMDEGLCRAFRAVAEKSGGLSDTLSIVVKIFGIIVLVTTLIPILGIVVLTVQMFFAPERVFPVGAVILLAVLGAVTVFGGIKLLKVSSKMEEKHRMYDTAIKNVIPQVSECYRYKIRQVLRYEYEVNDSTDYRYFIDLRDFLVEYPSPSEKWGRAEFAYAVVIKINGRDMFFLFIDEE